jgi:putative glycosyltransferase (TIGR04348 family)
MGRIPHVRSQDMKIGIVTPASAGSRHGNRITALRWARILRALGHGVVIEHQYNGKPYDVLIALHARRSFPAIDRWRTLYPQRPVIVALTGTDLYEDSPSHTIVKQSLDLAWRVIVLQPMAVNELPRSYRSKIRVIYQSAESPIRKPQPTSEWFEVCVLGHLRPIKDPFRTALAARLLPNSSCLRIVHLGAALSQEMEAQARGEMARNPRYHWLGDVPYSKAKRILSQSRLLVQSSVLEGGANAISEAIASGVPVLATAIPGSVGILGGDYPGYFPVTDTKALAALLIRVEANKKFYQLLRTRCRQLRPLVNPKRERTAWRRVLRELTDGRPRGRASHAR